MRQIKCHNCNEKCIKHGVLKSGSQRWFCKHCKVAFTTVKVVISVKRVKHELVSVPIFKLICLK